MSLFTFYFLSHTHARVTFIFFIAGFKSFQASVPFLYPRKTSENYWFSAVFIGCVLKLQKQENCYIQKLFYEKMIFCEPCLKD